LLCAFSASRNISYEEKRNKEMYGLRERERKTKERKKDKRKKERK